MPPSKADYLAHVESIEAARRKSPEVVLGMLKTAAVSFDHLTMISFAAGTVDFAFKNLSRRHYAACPAKTNFISPLRWFISFFKLQFMQRV